MHMPSISYNLRHCSCQHISVVFNLFIMCVCGWVCTHRQCAPVLGKKDSADDGPTRFTTAPKGSEADSTPGQLVVPVANGTSTGSLASDAPPAEGSNSSVTPAVKACKYGEVSVGNRCFKSSAGSRKAVTGTLAGSVVMLAAWQLLVILATGALAC